MKDNGYSCSGSQVVVVAGMQNAYPRPTDSYVDEHVLGLTSSDSNQRHVHRAYQKSDSYCMTASIQTSPTSRPCRYYWVLLMLRKDGWKSFAWVIQPAPRRTKVRDDGSSSLGYAKKSLMTDVLLLMPTWISTTHFHVQQFCASAHCPSWSTGQVCVQWDAWTPLHDKLSGQPKLRLYLVQIFAEHGQRCQFPWHLWYPELAFRYFMARSYANTSSLDKLFNSFFFLIKPEEFCLPICTPGKWTPAGVWLFQLRNSFHWAERCILILTSFYLCIGNNREWQTIFMWRVYSPVIEEIFSVYLLVA